MSALTLRQKIKPPCQVDASLLSPRHLANKSRAEVERIELTGWNQSFAIGDLFAVGGNDAARLQLQDLDGSFYRVGFGLQDGSITVSGNAGDYAGESMAGGTMIVKGNAGAYLGADLRDGAIEVIGDVGAFAGSGRAGSLRGMSGGTIIVRGNAGARAGDRMRRGLLIVEGAVGDYCASRMIAGTLVALGRAGDLPGYLMRRGTLILGDTSAALAPTFNASGDASLLALRMLLESIAPHARGLRALARHPDRLTRWLGDLACAGRGEVLVART